MDHPAAVVRLAALTEQLGDIIQRFLSPLKGAGVAQGFAEMGHHTGVASADFMGDGYRELVIGSREGKPQFWNNPCGTNHWVEVDLQGPPGNPRGLGAHVRADLGHRVDLREVSGSRGWSQSHARVHIGIGTLEQVAVAVDWPDGETVEWSVVPADRVVTVRHPHAVVP